MGFTDNDYAGEEYTARRTEIINMLKEHEGIALAIGTAVILLFTYLINELYYIPSGRHLVYCSPLGAFGEILCILLVTIPLIFSNSRSMCKADVTEF